LPLVSTVNRTCANSLTMIHSPSMRAVICGP
jgi:hypothetical protein